MFLAPLLKLALSALFFIPQTSSTSAVNYHGRIIDCTNVAIGHPDYDPCFIPDFFDY